MRTLGAFSSKSRLLVHPVFHVYVCAYVVHVYMCAWMCMYRCYKVDVHRVNHTQKRARLGEFSENETPRSRKESTAPYMFLVCFYNDPR